MISDLMEGVLPLANQPTAAEVTDQTTDWYSNGGQDIHWVSATVYDRLSGLAVVGDCTD